MIELHHGDNLRVMADVLRRKGPTVGMGYMDPPFLTGAVRKGKQGASFDDRWESLGEYIAHLRKRVELARELLLPSGCLVLHLDWRAVHYAKVMCDEVFGRDCFASEIIWRYRRWPSKTQNFQRVHDVLLRYVRDASVTPTFNQIYEPLAPSTRAAFGDSKQVAKYRGGKRHKSAKTAAKSPGVPMGDVWEIGIIAPRSNERTGYPTQKPAKLLERLLMALTNPGDLVLDPYCGSGTALDVARGLNCDAIGIDSSADAVDVCAKRLGIGEADIAHHS